MNDDEDNIIKEENEQDASSSSTNSNYYLRSKRRRLETRYAELVTSHYRPSESARRKNPIMYAPTEVLQNIFKFLTYHELSTKVRLVNNRFKVIAENILNLEFKNIDEKMRVLTKSTLDSLQSTQDDMEIKCICKLLNMLEVLKLQYTIIMATIWRYVYNDYYNCKFKTCMYAGLIIDAHKNFVWKFVHIPNILYAASILRDYAMPNEVSRIIHMSKIFCIHFDKITEEPLVNSVIYSGCKVIDLLDRAIFATRTVIFERNTLETFTAKYSYFLNNSWFITIPIVATKEMPLKQKQRMMHMRLRRIVLAHSDMFLQQGQYEREMVVRTNSALRLKKPGNNVYTGYGDVEDTFFYYGVMNDGAYMQKFHLDEDNDEEDDEEDANAAGNDNNPELIRNVSDEDILYRIPHLGVRIEVNVKCPLSFAPLKYLEDNQEAAEMTRRRRRTRGLTHINMAFECYGAYYPRLPTQFEYDFMPLRQ